MKKHFFFAYVLFLSLHCAAEQFPSVVVQLKYAPWGFIDADEQDFNYFFSEDESLYQKFDMNFDQSIGARLIKAPYYISANRSTTNLDGDIPDAIVETVSVGLGGAVLNFNEQDTYLIGAVGLGRGRFEFKDPDMNDHEAFFDANLEYGFHLDHGLLIGIGIDWQLFGRPGETKANYWNLYLGTGISF